MSVCWVNRCLQRQGDIPLDFKHGEAPWPCLSESRFWHNIKNKSSPSRRLAHLSSKSSRPPIHTYPNPAFGLHSRQCWLPPPPPPLLHCANQIESEVSLSEQMKDGKKLALGDQCLGDIDSAVLFLSLSLSLASPLPLILSEMVCASSNLHNTLLTPLL